MSEPATTGRARAVLAFGLGGEPQTILASVVAQIKPYSTDDRVRFVGPVAIDVATEKHVRDILIPLVDKIVAVLGIAKKNFELSVANPGGISVSGLSADLTGFSADLPMLLAMLSAVLQMPVADDLVATGHLASLDGDIVAVRALPAKLSAATDDPSIRRFVYPDLHRDRSLGVLTPREAQAAEGAVIQAKGRLKLTAVSTLSDLIKTVFTDDVIVLSALQNDFFSVDGAGDTTADSITRAAAFFTADNQRRFWNVLEHYFHAGDPELAQRLLLTYVQFHLRCQTYPSEFGRRLLQLLRSLPPETRRNKITFPILAILDCVKLSQFAGESDAGDIRLLYDAAEGKAIWTEPVIPAGPVVGVDPEDKDQALVDAIVSRIDSSQIARTVSVPIDTARATYRLNSLTVKSNEEFHDVVSAFYLHLQRHIQSVSESVDMGMVKDEAVALVERTFADEGGSSMAMTEAADAIRGGMKFILDAITEQFKTECQGKYVNRVIRDALGPLNREAQISFISALLKRLAPHLPHEIATASPERFVAHYEVLVKGYVKSLDKINEVFRRF